MEIRTVELTDGQYDRLWQDFVAEQMIGKTLATMLVEMADQRARLNCERWETVEKLAGIDKQTETVVIDWARRVLSVRNISDHIG